MTLYLCFKAPFGTFKPFQSVEMLATTAFITHSAAYGFLLGLAGINRDRKEEFIGAQIAIGMKHTPQRGRTYHQLHVNPQNPKADEIQRAKGTKQRIRPYWREVLINLEGYIGLKDERLEPLVRQGVNEPQTLNYWGLPFMGDNNFFLERLDVIPEPEKCQWFCPLEPENVGRDDRYIYLSIWTDYASSETSNSLLFSMRDNLDKAWVTIEKKQILLR